MSLFVSSPQSFKLQPLISTRKSPFSIQKPTPHVELTQKLEYYAGNDYGFDNPNYLNLQSIAKNPAYQAKKHLSPLHAKSKLDPIEFLNQQYQVSPLILKKLGEHSENKWHGLTIRGAPIKYHSIRNSPVKSNRDHCRSPNQVSINLKNIDKSYYQGIEENQSLSPERQSKDPPTQSNRLLAKKNLIPIEVPVREDSLEAIKSTSNFPLQKSTPKQLRSLTQFIDIAGSSAAPYQHNLKVFEQSLSENDYREPVRDKERRCSIKNPLGLPTEERSSTPGPDLYKMPNDFGYYEAKRKQNKIQQFSLSAYKDIIEEIEVKVKSQSANSQAPSEK